MSDESYFTLKTPSEGFYKEKGSKFYGFAYPVNSIEEAKEKLDLLRKEYHDARHHCMAYSIRTGEQIVTRASDDGEPNHSAGDPILGQIKSFELQNVVVIVVRYFGGTKLGVSGLIHAYKTAAYEALSSAKIIEVIPKKEITIEYPYEKTNEIMRLISEFQVEIVDQSFEEKCTLTGRMLPVNYNILKEKLKIVLTN